MPTPLISIIVLNYNGKRFNEVCLNSIVRQITTEEVIFADNASTDESLMAARRTFEQSAIRWVQNGGNLGYAGGNNRAAAVATGKFLLFLNNDIELAEDGLRCLTECLCNNPDLIAAQCALLDYTNRDRLETAGVDVDVFGLCYGRNVGERWSDAGNLETIFSAVGAAFVVRADWFRKLGGFDESYFLTYEETDLCWRIWRAGGSVVYLPKVRVYHIGSGTRSKASYQTYLFVRNRIWTLKKNVDPGLLPIALVGNIVSMAAMAALYMMRRGAALPKAIFKGVIDGLWCRSADKAPHRPVVSTLQLIKAGVLKIPSASVLKNLVRYRI